MLLFQEKKAGKANYRTGTFPHFVGLGRHDEGASITAENMTVTFHSLFLAVCVGSAATDTTVWILLGIDFSINIFWCILVFYR